MIEYNVTLHISKKEKDYMEERMKNDGSSPEIWIKKAICAFSDGLLFCGDDVWCRPSKKPVEDDA